MKRARGGSDCASPLINSLFPAILPSSLKREESVFLSRMDSDRGNNRAKGGEIIKVMGVWILCGQIARSLSAPFRLLSAPVLRSSEQQTQFSLLSPRREIEFRRNMKLSILDSIFFAEARLESALEAAVGWIRSSELLF